MRSIMQTCTPRPDIIQGTFNPEIFTASLSHVMEFYRTENSTIDTLYTNASLFFGEATYPTEGLKNILQTALGRVAGDSSLPAIQRLETSFGGGKTHALIALTHLGFRGKELSAIAADIVPENVLHQPGEIFVVGIAGDELPVHKPQGTTLVPYTLWGEIAYQVGGEELYTKVQDEVSSHAAPGLPYFKAVLDNRKGIIMLDELAQYAARLQAARPDGSQQLAAFLMGLFGYVRNHPGISVVITLASSSDAFGKQTGQIVKIISGVKGQDVSEEEAQSIIQDADKEVQSVVSRDATTVVPVQKSEISRVLSKRLFLEIDDQAGQETAEAYAAMYGMYQDSLPRMASQDEYKQVMAAHYPFHPSFINFLNGKMATIETFQGTRGVLRILAIAVRNLWENHTDTPMIHTCHLNMKNARTVNEIIGRTGSGDLLPILNSDIGGPDTEALAAGKSYAAQADANNPHPAGIPFHEFTWKTIFLHSLVGRGEGFSSNVFGIPEQEALLEVSQPELTPPQIKKALDEIEDSAQYLRFDHGRYFASLEPTINRALTSIRETIRPEHVTDLIASTARNVVKGDNGLFNIHHAVSVSEDIPDKNTKPSLGLIALDAESLSAEDIVTHCGPNRPRLYQNLIFLLFPKTVREADEVWNSERQKNAAEILSRINGLTKTVLAMSKLKGQPEDFGITSAMLAKQNFERKFVEKRNGLLTTITQAYNGIWFPAASGHVTRKEISTAGGEGGTAVIEEIKRVLKQEGELIASSDAATQETCIGLKRLFYETTTVPKISEIRENFACKRHWPILENMGLLDEIIKKGIGNGSWCLFRMGETEIPESFYSRDTNPVPFNLDLNEPDWSIISMQEAKKRNWGPQAVDITKVTAIVDEYVKANEAVTFADTIQTVHEQYAEITEEKIQEIVSDSIRKGRVGTYTGLPSQIEKPTDLTFGKNVVVPVFHPDQILVKPATIGLKGWQEEVSEKFTLTGREGADKIFPLLKRLSSIYNRGGKSHIDLLEMVDLELPNGGKASIRLEDASPDDIEALDEFFEIVSDRLKQGNETEIDIEINEPEEGCSLIQELEK